MVAKYKKIAIKPIETVALGLIISSWGITHFIVKYIQLVMNLKGYNFILGIQTGRDQVSSLLGLSNIFSLSYIIFWVGFGLIISVILQQAINKALKIRLNKKKHKKEKL